MKIKICGITNIEDALFCCNMGADALGFIFYKKSKRYIKPEDAKKIIMQLPPFILKVGVFVNETSSNINRIAKDVKLNLVQLHGDESPEDAVNIELPVIKAFRVDNNFNYETLDKYSNCSFLLDTFSKKEYGGTGEIFNWGNIPDKIKNKIILAGGVSAKNLEQIYNNISPYAIDVSSSIELEPGKKDHKKIKQLFTKYNELGK